MKSCLAVLGMSALSISSSVFALEYPEPSNPAAQALIAQYKQDKSWIDSPSLFDIPNPPPAWPCAISEVEQYKVAGFHRMHPELKADFEKLMRKSMRESGFSASMLPKDTYSNIRIIPLKAQCKDGVLDGDLELLTTYDQKSELTTKTTFGEKVVTGTTITTMSHISRTGQILKMGKPTSASKTFSLMSTQVDTRYDDDRMEAANRKSNKTLGMDKPTTMKSITYTAEDKTMAVFMDSEEKEVSSGLFSVKVKPVQALLTTISIPVDERRLRTETYKNKRLIATGITKDGKQHGEQVMYMDNYLKKLKLRLDQQPNMENAREVKIDGVDLIEMRTCFQNGVQIKITPCPSE